MSNQQVVDVAVANSGVAVGETQVIVEVESSQQQHQSSVTTSVLDTNAQQLQQQPKLTPEQEEEIKLRSKYPNPNRPPCGSALVQKLLHKGVSSIYPSEARAFSTYLVLSCMRSFYLKIITCQNQKREKLFQILYSKKKI
jgi:hypothetical protein